MPSFLQVDNLSKSYGPKILFDKISFNINEGDKIALVAPNGTGKTTLLKILAGEDKSDSGGSIKFLRDVRIAFLKQEEDFDGGKTLRELLYDNDSDHCLRLDRILTELGLHADDLAGELSGGERKRAAIARMLACDADFYIMDEPTNHLDLDGIEYLEAALKKSRCTLFMVTHDRYFLDRVCNTVMEMDRGDIYIYRGDYENFLEKRDERISNFNAQTDKVRNILRRELEWIHATPCARSGKAKYRKDAFVELKERAAQTHIERNVSMAGVASSARLGTKIIDCDDLCFNYGDTPIVSHFSYKMARGERIGIVGENGIGKSTFLNLLVEGRIPAISRGESVRIGYYRQTGISFREDDTVLDIVPDTRLLEQFLFPRDMWPTRVSRLSGGEKRRLYLLTVLMQEPNVLVLDEPTNDLDIVTLNVLEEYVTDFKGSLLVVTHDRHFLDRIVDHLFVFCGAGAIKDFIGGYSEYRSFITDLKAEQRHQERVENQKRAAAAARKSTAGETAATRMAPAADGKAAARLSTVAGNGKEATGLSDAVGQNQALSGPRKLSFKEKRELEALEARLQELNAEKAELEAAMSGGTAVSGSAAGSGGGAGQMGGVGQNASTGQGGLASYEIARANSLRYEQLHELIDAAETRWLELNC